jgi:hypothetical protein
MAASAINMETVNGVPAPERLLGVIVYVLTEELVVGVPDNAPVTGSRVKPDYGNQCSACPFIHSFIQLFDW